MSYPERRYSGGGGEISARLRPGMSDPASAPRPEPEPEPEPEYHYLATTASTGGEFGLYRLDMGPEPGGPAVRFHRTISEIRLALGFVQHCARPSVL